MSTKREVEAAGGKLWFCAMTGRVVGEKKWSETRISSSGGGGYINQGSGFISAPQVSTRVSTRHEFWLQAPDGEERCVELNDSNTAVREGQILTAVWGARVGKESGPYLFVHNHTAAKESWLIANEKVLLKGMGLADPFLRCTLAGGAVTLYLSIQNGHMASLEAWTPALLCAVLGVFLRRAKVRNLKQAGQGIFSLELKALRQPSPQASFQSSAAGPRLPA